MPVLLPVHIVAGGLAIIVGGTALVAAKGGWLHRKSGLLFVYAMLTMGISASILALKRGITNSNFLGGLMSVYFVVTALTTVHPVSAWTARVNLGAAALAFALALYEIGLGVKAIAAGRMTLNGAPVPMLFFLAAIALTAGIGDVRVMQSGPLRGAPRLKRHLWRMCFALFIAAGSFFAAMFYWIWRLRSRRNLAPAV